VYHLQHFEAFGTAKKNEEYVISRLSPEPQKHFGVGCSILTERLIEVKESYWMSAEHPFATDATVFTIFTRQYMVCKCSSKSIISAISQKAISQKAIS
jgi:hypothetical protein